MLEHNIEQIEMTRKYFISNKFLFKKINVGGRNLEYFVLPQKLNNDLPDFVYRVTNSALKQYVMGVSESVPETLQPYFILEEYIEFMEKGINYENRVIESEKEVVSLIPSHLKKDYLQRRIALFLKELEQDKKDGKKYNLGKKGRLEFEKNIYYLNTELANISGE